MRDLAYTRPFFEPVSTAGDVVSRLSTRSCTTDDLSAFPTAVARQMVPEGRTQTVLGPERGRDVRRRHVAVLRRQPDGVLRDSAAGRPVREHGAAAATGSERDAGLHAAGAHHPR